MGGKGMNNNIDKKNRRRDILSGMAAALRRAGAVLVIMSLLLLMFENIPGQAKAKLSAKKVTIEVGEKYTVKLTGLSSKKTAQWSVSKTKVLKKVKTTRNSIKVKGKKVGTSYVTATVGAKTYKCKIKVVAKQDAVQKTVVRSFDDFDSFAGEVAGLVKSNPIKAGSGTAATDRFATARLLVKSKSGSLPLDGVKFTDAIKGSDNVYVIQFDSQGDAQDAFAGICELDDVEWAEPDSYIGTSLDLNVPERLDGGYDFVYPDEDNVNASLDLDDFPWLDLPDLGIPGLDDLLGLYPGEPDTTNPDSYDPGTPGTGYPDPYDPGTPNIPVTPTPAPGYPGGGGHTSDPNRFLSWGVTKLGADVYAETVGSSSITVAVVDTGVAAHSFLSGRVVSGYDYIENDSDPTDYNSHGTHVAGTIVDCTPGLNVYIMPVRVLGTDGGGTDTTVGLGIRYAADHGASVVNLSLGGGHSNYLDESVRYAINKGVTVVAAAGNDYSDTVYSCPAHMTEPIVVGAVDSNDVKAAFSNIGNSVDVVAPGVGITSCVPSGDYATYDGTSMATPHISAVAAMLLLKHPGYTPAQIESLIKSSARDLGSAGWDKYYGYGMPDLSNISDVVIPPTSVRIEPDSLKLNVGSSTKLSAYITPSNATDLSIYWSSSNTGVAIVDANGYVTAISQGTAYIYATASNGVSAYCPVTVSAGTGEVPDPTAGPAPSPTKTPYPTLTPTPTKTPYPTTGPSPTQAPNPTWTPLPTQSPTPTPTQTPVQPVPNPGPGEGTNSGFKYSILGDSITITGYSGTDSSLVIPAKIDGYRVTAIGTGAFTQNSQITSVRIEADATVGMSAFTQCSNLRSVEFAGNISAVGMSAFAQCSSLTDIKITGQVYEIGMSAFVQCSSLKTLTLNSSVRIIGMSAFAQCNNLSVINYYGTSNDWNGISIGMGNEQLRYAALRLC